jgi:hypothetical protein
MNRAWGNIKNNIQFSAQESLGYCESNNINRDLMSYVQNWFIQGSRLNCIGCGIEVKRMKIT